MQQYLAALLVVALAGCQSTGEKNVKLETQQDKVSYSIGLNIGQSLKKDSIAISPDAFMRGVLDAGVDSAGRLMNDKEIQETMMAFQDSMRARQMALMKVEADKNRTAGDAFLAENARKPGVVTLPSGLQYRVITEGKGKTPIASSTVRTHYRGRLLDGTEFDSSYKHGQPAQFAVNGVMPGWSQALQMMKEGSKWELFVPASLGYGEAGAGGVIPPNATLIFEVELIEVL
jgi:FKBP-type peptidyl-prolyl cis-trans isomerase FklB